jgi:hypothetical protein
MDKIIYINVDPFSKNSSIYIAYEGANPSFVGSYNLEDIPSAIVELSNELGVNSVKIVGAGKFSQLIEYGIIDKEMTKYNKNKIEIEVI